MRKILLTALSFVILSIPLRSQTLKAYLTAADEAFETEQYYPALVYYTNALEFNTDNIDVVYKTAEAARLFSAFSLAEGYYQKVLDNDSDNKFPLASFMLGEVKQKLAKYDQAKTSYNLYLSEHSGEEEYYTTKANKEIAACDFAANAINNPNPRYSIKPAEGVNTAYSEVGPRMIGEKLYYSSMRFGNEGDTDIPADKFSRILEAENGNGRLMRGDINNTTMHVAHLSHNTKGDRAYYSICSTVSDVELACEIYYRDIDESGIYGDPVKLPEQINAENSSNTQPSIAYDSERDKEVMFFVSTREGGKGNKDIWYSVIDGESYSQPVALNELNTLEDEEGPFYHAGSGALYFSSNGYQGLGGYDIYKSYRSGQSFGTPENLPAPVNSSFNDAHYWLSEDGLKAYFASDRAPGSLYSDEEYEACCYDIYDADIKEVKIDLEVLTFDKKSLVDLDSCTVTVYDLRDNSIVDQQTNPVANDFNFNIVSDRNYMIVAERNYYYNDTILFSTRGINESQKITKKAYLATDYLFLKVLPIDKTTKDPIAGVRVSVGNQVAETPTATSYTFVILPNTAYEIFGAKQGYNPGRNKVGPEEGENVTFITKIIELNRYPFLPLTLYFDNDHPNPRSSRTFTKLKYTDTYNPYINKKEEFKSNYSSPLEEVDQEAAKQAVEDFFEIGVKGGYTKLQSFMSSLLQHLQNGYKLEISIRGYTSPLANPKYNLKLGQRRVSSVRNEIEKYMDGIFMKYLNPVSGDPLLIITDISYGETTAPSGISDKSSDKRNSVFSPDASKERRAQIVRVESID